METLKKYIYHPEIDFIRIICTFSVIMIHITTKILAVSGNDLFGHPFTLFLNQLSSFAVPIFFMISAFGLKLNYSANLKFFPYLKQRLSKILLPYLFWSFIYYYFVYPHNSQSFFRVLLLGGASYQLYFIPTLFIFYLLFPLIYRYFKFISRPLPLIILFIIQFIFLSIDYYYRPLSFFAYPIKVFILNFIFFILGMLAGEYQSEIYNFVKAHQKKIIFLSLIFALYITFESAFRYFKTQNYLSFYSQWRPGILLYSISLSSLLYYFGKNTKISAEFIKKFSSYSFFIYFIHIIFIEIIWKYLPHTLLSSPFVSFFLVLIPSSLFAHLISKIPKLSRLTG